MCGSHLEVAHSVSAYIPLGRTGHLAAPNCSRPGETGWQGVCWVGGREEEILMDSKPSAGSACFSSVPKIKQAGL